MHRWVLFALWVLHFAPTRSSNPADTGTGSFITGFTVVPIANFSSGTTIAQRFETSATRDRLNGASVFVSSNSVPSDVYTISLATGLDYSSVVRSGTVSNITVGGEARVSFPTYLCTPATTYYLLINYTGPGNVWLDGAESGYVAGEVYIDFVTAVPKSLKFATYFPGPSISVYGNNSRILDGASPSVATLTDFGTLGVEQGSSPFAPAIYYVFNQGGSPLILPEGSSVSLGGNDPSQFLVLGQPSSQIDRDGGNSTLSIGYVPVDPGTHTATVFIYHNDDGGQFTFNVVGRAVAQAPSTPQNVSADRLDRAASVNFVTFLLPNNQTYYTVTARATSFPFDVHTAVGDQSPIIVTDLVNGRGYQVWVNCTNSVGSSGDSLSGFVTPATVPGIPTNVVANFGNSSATVTWTNPPFNGGAPILGYWVTAIPASGSPILPRVSIFVYPISQSGVSVPGLRNGRSYTIIVNATNAVGAGSASLPSAAVIPATVPSAPTIVDATRGQGQVSLTFTPPADNGGDPNLRYHATSTPDGKTVTGTDNTLTVTGLRNGISYTFVVAASNKAGLGRASSPSSAVKPGSQCPAMPSTSVPEFANLGTCGVEHAHDTTCRFGCDSGYTLVGTDWKCLYGDFTLGFDETCVATAAGAASKAVQSQLKLLMPVSNVTYWNLRPRGFAAQFATDVATALAVNISRVRSTPVKFPLTTQGMSNELQENSVPFTVDYYVLPDATGHGIVLQDVNTRLRDQLLDPLSPLLSGQITRYADRAQTVSGQLVAVFRCGDGTWDGGCDVSDKPVTKEAWFIVVMIILAIVVLAGLLYLRSRCKKHGGAPDGAMMLGTGKDQPDQDKPQPSEDEIQMVDPAVSATSSPATGTGSVAARKFSDAEEVTEVRLHLPPS